MLIIKVVLFTFTFICEYFIYIEFENSFPEANQSTESSSWHPLEGVMVAPPDRQTSLPRDRKLRSETKPGGSHVATFLTFVLEAGAAPVVAGESTLGPANEKDETRFSSQSGASWGLRGPGPCCKTRTV